MSKLTTSQSKKADVTSSVCGNFFFQSAIYRRIVIFKVGGALNIDESTPCLLPEVAVLRPNPPIINLWNS